MKYIRVQNSDILIKVDAIDSIDKGTKDISSFAEMLQGVQHISYTILINYGNGRSVTYDFDSEVMRDLAYNKILSLMEIEEV